MHRRMFSDILILFNVISLVDSLVFQIREKLEARDMDLERLLNDVTFLTEECDRFERLLRNAGSRWGDKERYDDKGAVAADLWLDVQQGTGGGRGGGGSSSRSSSSSAIRSSSSDMASASAGLGRSSVTSSTPRSRGAKHSVLEWLRSKPSSNSKANSQGANQGSSSKTTSSASSSHSKTGSSHSKTR